MIGVGYSALEAGRFDWGKLLALGFGADRAMAYTQVEPHDWGGKAALPKQAFVSLSAAYLALDNYMSPKSGFELGLLPLKRASETSQLLKTRLPHIFWAAYWGLNIVSAERMIQTEPEQDNMCVFLWVESV